MKRLHKVLALVAAVAAPGMVLATETIPTDITGATTAVTANQATVESYGAWGLFIMAGIAATVVAISWFKAAKARR